MSMKRFTLIIVAALLTTLSFAQKPAATLNKIVTPPAKVLADAVLTSQNATSRVLKAPRKAEAPAGTAKTYIRSGSYISSDGYIYSQSGFTTIVFGENNKVYFEKLVYSLDFNAWIEGTLSDDGTKITVPMGQQLGTIQYGDVFLGIGYPSSAQTMEGNLTFTVSGNKITLDTYTNYTIGVVSGLFTFNGNLYFTANAGLNYGDYATAFELFEEPETITVPDNLETEDMPFTGSENASTDYATTVKVGWDGSDVYIQGFNKFLPEAWIKGTLGEDNIVTFPVQYMGKDDTTPYFLTGYSSSGTLPGAKMEYSADDNTFTGSGTINLNGNNSSWSSIVFYNGVIIGHAPEPITVPDGLVTESYPISATDNSSANYSGTVEVGIDGTDIYFKNLLANVPDAWVKGTIADDGTVTIPIQYAGKNSGYGIGMYAVGYSNSTFTDIVLQYYADYDVFVAQNVIAASAKKNSWSFYFDDDILQNAVIGVPPVSVTANTSDETTYYATFYDADFNYVADADTKVYTAKVDESGEWMNLSEVANKVIPAGTAVILEGKAATITLKGSRAAAEAVENNDLKGASEAKAPAEGVTTYVLANGDAGVGFYKFAGETLAAGKAYIEIAGDAAAKVLTFGETTAINGVADVKADKAVIYNLAGQRVNNAQKGVFIQNGKKVVF